MKRLYAFFISCFFLFIPNINYGQELSSPHEISFSTSLGVSMFQFDDVLSLGKTKGKFGWGFDAGYKYNFNEEWSIGSGIGLFSYKSSIELNQINHSYPITDKGGNQLVMRYKLSDYKENISSYFITIPLMARYQTKGESIGLYASAGGKIALPTSSKTRSKSADFRTEGYNSIGEIISLDNPSLGFGKFYREPIKNSLHFKTSFMLSAEVGARFNLDDKVKFYVGGYVDYGLNNIAKHYNKRFIQYNAESPSHFTHNSFIESSINNKDGKVQQNLVDKIKPLSFGLKVGLSFMLGSDKNQINRYYKKGNRKNQVAKPIEIDPEFYKLSQDEKLKRIERKERAIKTRNIINY